MNRLVLLCLVMTLGFGWQAHSRCAWAQYNLEKVPRDAVMVLHVDWADLVQTDIFTKYAQMFGEMMPTNDPEFQEYKAATGFDPETDLQSITFVATGGQTGKMDGLTVLHGNFEPAKFEAYGKEKGMMEIGEVQGVKTFTLIDDDPGTVSISGGAAAASSSGVAMAELEPAQQTMAFLDENTMIMASTEHFTNMLERTQGENIHSSPMLGPLLNEGMTGQIWMAVILPDMAKEQLKSQPPAVALANVQSVSMAIQVSESPALTFRALVDTPVHGQLAYSTLAHLVPEDGMISAEGRHLAEVLSGIQLDSENREDALLIFDALNSLHAMGKMMSAENPDLGNLLNKLTLEQDGASVHANLAVSEADLERSMGMAMIMMGGFGGGE